jgi:hypothetical protein
VTADNQLRIAYATYWFQEARTPPPRRMSIGKLSQNPTDGTLVFTGIE